MRAHSNTSNQVSNNQRIPTVFATKPHRANHSRHNAPCKVITNYHQLNVTSKNGNIFKYSIQISPEVAQSGPILKLCREQLKKVFTFYQSNIYSYDMTTDEIVAKVNHDGQDFTVTVSFSKAVGQDDPEVF